MSAIAGIIQFDDKTVDKATLDRMESLLEPYGRDSQQQWQNTSTGLLRTLLRTTPEDSFDQQPLMDSSGQLVILFDGRIDNREELADKLGLDADQCKVMADSEVVLHACLRWDTKAVEHLLGDFAIACWQPKQRRLWLARDPMGYRPLYWHKQAGFFAFASMPKALFAIPGVPRALSEERLANYLALLPMTDADSFFKDIYRVEPGQILILENEHITTQRYHEFDPDYELQLGSDDEYLEAFGEHLERAVACRLRSTGSIASQLSSGFDSSTVTAIAATQLAQKNKNLLAYTAVPREGFNGSVPRGRHADESIAARELVKRFDNIEHILIPPDGVSPIDNLQQATEMLDRGPLNPCNMVWAEGIHADAANRGAKVLLTGSMGNMTISYTGEQYLPALLGQGRWLKWWHEAKALQKASPNWRWRGLFGQSIGPFMPPWLWQSLQKVRGKGWKLTDYTAINPQFLASMGGETGIAQKAGWDTSYRPWANGREMRIAVINRLDNGEYFSALNTHGLEMRDPTSDMRLLKFCLSVPDDQYLRNGQTRWLLHRLMGDTLPPEMLYPKTKGLQAADWYEGIEVALPRFQEELKRMAEHGLIGEYLDLDAMLQSLEEWPESGWENDHIIQTYRLKLLRGLSVGTFIRYVEGNNR
jgi:asparagine synthase (glutamine-hydrolysing)